MKKSNILITLKKELRSIFRDKKTILTIFCFPIIITIFIFLFGLMENSIVGSEEDKYAIGINYDLDNTEKTLMSELFLEPKQFETLEEMQDAYEKKLIETYIYYSEDENKYIIYSSDDLMNSHSATYAMEYLEAYNKYLGDLYIKGEDIDPKEAYGKIVYEMKATDGEEISLDGFMINMVMDMCFTYIITIISIAAVNMATSAIAVEKENGTLETILTLPVTTKELLVGKYLATFIMGFVASIFGFMITIISLFFASTIFDGYKEFSVTLPAILWGIIICAVASLFIAAISILLTSSSKSYKEAQASGQIIQMACIIPMFISLLNLKITSIYYIIPILNHTKILFDLYSENINYMYLFLTVFSTLIYVIIIGVILIKKFNSEKVLFGE